MKVSQLLGLQGPWRHKVWRDIGCLHRRRLPIRVFFRASCSQQSEGLFGQSFSVALPVQALRGPPCLGSFFVVWHVRHIEGAPLGGVLVCRSAHQSLKEAPWVGSYLVVQCIRCLMRQPIVQLPMLACGEREAMVMAPPALHDSTVSPCFHDCPAFLHRHFPPQSPPSHPLDTSLQSQQQPSPWDCCTIPELQLPAAAPSRGPVSLSRACMAAARTVCCPFHLGCHGSASSLPALNVSPLTQPVAPMWGLDPCLSAPTW